jgi:hypothetical protein
MREERRKRKGGIRKEGKEKETVERESKLDPTSEKIKGR